MKKQIRLLITGIPGMGKTTIGNHLRDQHHFVHVDMECIDNINKFNDAPEVFINYYINLDTNLVISWGFAPNESEINYINNLFKNKEFDLIWLDGDRDAAYDSFVARDSQYGKQYLEAKLGALKNQLKNIFESKVIDRINPKIINTFDSHHQFRKLEEIVREIKNEQNI